jgi:glutamine synthetase
MAKTVILPATLRYQTELATNVASLRAVDMEADTSTLEEVTAAITDLHGGIPTLRTQLADRARPTARQEAEHAATLLPAMRAVRAAADALAAMVADDLWPLPTYQEMLYIL